MRRGAKPAKPKVEAKPPIARKSPKPEASRVRDLEKRLAEALKDKAEALEQQTATAEILRVISNLPSDYQPVFDTIVRSAGVVCGAADAILWIGDGDELVVHAHHGPLPARIGARQPIRGSVAGYAVHEARVIHIEDVTESDDFPVGRDVARRLGWRTVLSAPLLRGGLPIGAILIRRREVRPFTESQIKLLETFADQAVIAIENVRLFKELEGRNRDLTATAEILQVISSSPTDVQPVFDTIVRSAVRLCDGLFSALRQFDGELLHHVAQHNFTPEALEAVPRVWPARPTRASGTGRAILERAVVHIPDSEVDPEHQHQALRRAVGWRSGLFVPMLREGAPIGVIMVARAEPRPFSDNEIDLMKTFADQAVIAVENVRLFKELQEKNRALSEANAQVTESLEQQTATSEILRVISSSPTDVQPVFDIIAERAVRLCDGLHGGVYRFDGTLIHFVAHYNWTPEGLEAVQRVYPRAPSRETQVSTAILDGTVVEVRDFDAPAVPPSSVPLARALGYRSILAIPMLRHGKPIGAIAVSRAKPGPFSDSEIELLKTFADQAVIAVENVRLFKELEARNRDLTKALDTQTATSDILRVISSSPTEIQPVFDAILGNSLRLCDAAFGGVVLLEGQTLAIAAAHNLSTEQLTLLQQSYPRPRGRDTATGRAIEDRRVIHIPDITADSEYDYPLAGALGVTGILAVPLLREAAPVGAIGMWRRDGAPFSEQQISLVQTFADQAVIAIENVRLFTELGARNRDLTEALEQQTATGEILRVISSSPTDAQPVFDTIVRSSDRLLGGLAGSLALRVGDEVHLVALTPTNPGGDAVLRRLYPMQIGADGGHAEVVRLCRPLMIADTEAELTGRTREFARIRGFRSRLSVPLIRDGIAIGSLGVTRAAPGVFTDREIALLQTFADQAVIAIENVRLFTELQTSNRELTTALDTQTATGDILRVISRSQADVQPVFDAIVHSAVHLLRGNASSLSRIEGSQIALAAMTSTDDPGDASQRARFPMSIHSAEDHAQAVRNRAPLNITDAHSDPRLPETQHASARLRGYRSLVVVPLVRHDEAVGTLGVSRREPGGFTDDEIALLQTFADQAVIAIENVRLLTELQARTQELSRSVGELQALGEVGQAISSTLDLETVLTTIVSRAVQLSALDGGVVFEYDEGTEEFVQRAGTDPGGALAEARRTTRIRKGEGVLGRTAITLEPIQVPDITVPAAYEGRLREILVESGVRAILAVPMVREGRLIGCLGVTRNQPGEFPAETIELLRTFATQSALAIQNARLFHEIADKSRQLEAASRHKSEFLANMSHELRTPLNAIIGFSEVLAERMFGEVNAKQAEYLQDILESGRHLLSLINDILDLSKIEAGRMELEPADFDLPSAIDNALILVRERASRHGITLASTIDEHLGLIRGDERKVKQVLLNLLSNALKFTPEGGRIDVRATLHEGRAEVSVADTGVGIALEDQEAVFEEFRQVGTADKKVEGTGLGLALSQKFVQLHGGRIWVESELGRGSTFTFTLPVS